LYLSSEQGAAWGFLVSFIWCASFSDGRKYLSAAMCALPSRALFVLARIFFFLHMSPLFLSLEISDGLVWVVYRSSFIVFVLFTPDMNERRVLIPAFERKFYANGLEKMYVTLTKKVGQREKKSFINS